MCFFDLLVCSCLLDLPINVINLSSNSFACCKIACPTIIGLLSLIFFFFMETSAQKLLPTLSAFNALSFASNLVMYFLSSVSSFSSSSSSSSASLSINAEAKAKTEGSSSSSSSSVEALVAGAVVAVVVVVRGSLSNT